MEMIQCKNGHFYDASRNAECPYCSAGTDIAYTRPLGGETEFNKTMPVSTMEAPAFPKTVSIGTAAAQGAQGNPAFPKTVPLNNPQTNVTVALHVNEKGIDPVRGWLVCTEGEKKGKDFRIHSEKNFIGRAKSNDICLDFDETISRECNAVLSYDAKKNKFWLQSGEGKSNIYVNDEILLVPVELKAYDTIQIGSTQLVFVPLCTDKFNW